jgi:hypothetical protein
VGNLTGFKTAAKAKALDEQRRDLLAGDDEADRGRSANGRIAEKTVTT